MVIRTKIIHFVPVREGGGGPLEGVGPENPIKLTTCNTEYRIQLQQNSYIKLPMYLFFYMGLGLGFAPIKIITPALYKQQVH